MAEDSSMQLRLVANRKIFKYAEGADPEVDEPFEVIEKEDVFVGEEAKQLLNRLNGVDQ